ncbi:MAG: hypothetical protein IPM27_05015 [Nitrosomonadales bacterium]|nr:hypothetical protein [Nitrosomonadales bacterium]
MIELPGIDMARHFAVRQNARENLPRILHQKKFPMAEIKSGGICRLIRERSRDLLD